MRYAKLTMLASLILAVFMLSASYGYAAEAFERAGNIWWQGEARGRQGWRQAQLGDWTLENNAESVEWYQSSIDCLTPELVGHKRGLE